MAVIVSVPNQPLPIMWGLLTSAGPARRKGFESNQRLRSVTVVAGWSTSEDAVLSARDVVVFVPHVAGVVLWSDLQRPWLAERFDEAISGTTFGQPVFRDSSAALAWAAWARDQPGLDALHVGVVQVRATVPTRAMGSITRLVVDPGDVAAALPIEPQPDRVWRPSTPVGPPPDAEVAEAFEAIAAEAKRIWPLLSAEPWLLARVTLVAALAWSAGYDCSYRGAVDTVADRIARLATAIGNAELAVEPSAAPDYTRLATVASADHRWPELSPRIPDTILARAGVTAALDTSPLPVSRVVAYEAFTAAVEAGAEHGARYAGDSIHHRWRDASSDVLGGGWHANGTVDVEVGRLIGTTCRQVTNEWTTATVRRAPTPQAVARGSFPTSLNPAAIDGRAAGASPAGIDRLAELRRRNR